jgi:hypothetical protein
VRGRLVIAFVALLIGGSARADLAGDLRAREVDVARLETERTQLEARRGRLASESQRLAGEIERTKAEPPGVRRDAQLQELLAQQQSTADELQRLSAIERTQAQSLLQARRTLMATCDRALATPLSEARRLELTRLRTAQATLLAAPPQPLGIGKAPEASTLDGPRDLQEKADLLRDSEDKLKREVARLASRIDDVERRRHLRERAGAVDEDVFGELTSNRHVAHAATSSTSGADRGSGGAAAAAPAPSGGGTPSAAAGGAGGAGGASNGAGGAPGQTGGGSTGAVSGVAPPSFGLSGSDTAGKTSDANVVLRNLVDPVTLDELRRADGSDDLERQLRALRRAQGELTGLAAELGKRARALSVRADELKHRK